MITLGLVDSVDTNGVYVTMPGSRGVLRGPYKSLSTVAAGTTVLVASTDDGEQVVVGPAPTGDGVVSVLSFGAKGDGTTDDAAAIQAALDAAAAIRGTLVIPPGTYRVRSTLSVGSNTTLRGTGTLDAVIPGAQAPVLWVNADDVHIEGITIVGNIAAFAGTTEWKHGISICSANRVTVRDVTTTDNKGDGVYVGSGTEIGSPTGDPSTAITLENVTSVGNHRQGLSVTCAVGVRVFGGTFADTDGTAPQSGIDIEPDSAAFELRDVQIVGAQCDGNTGHGISIVLHDEAQGDVQVLGGSASNNGKAGVYFASAWRVRLSGLDVSDNAEDGVQFAGSGTVKDVHVADCTINRNGQAGIYVNLGTTFSGLTVTGCTVLDNDVIGVGNRGSGGPYATGHNRIGNDASADTDYGLYTYSTVTPQVHTWNHFESVGTADYAWDGGKGADTVVLQATPPAVTGSRGGNAALASLLTELANLGLITDSSS